MAQTVLQRFSYSGAPRILGGLLDAVTVIGVNLLERRGGLQFLWRVSQGLLKGETVVELPAFHIYNRDHVGGVLTDEVKESFPFHQLPADPIDQEMLIDGVKIEEENQTH